jgi:hypothetical protein
VGVLTDDGREVAAEGVDDFDGEVAARPVSLSCSPLIADSPEKWGIRPTLTAAEVKN